MAKNTSAKNTNTNTNTSVDTSKEEAKLPETTVQEQLAPVGGTSPEHSTAEAKPPVDMSSKLAALAAGAQAEAQQAQQQQAPVKTQRTSSTVHKITSTPSVGLNGEQLQRRNTNIKDRQVVAIVSESAKLAHITTDINYAVLTQAAAVNKANKELIKQMQIKAICNQPDLKVLVTQQRWPIEVQEGDSIPMQQRAKAEVYGYWASRGFTMLGNIRRNVASAGSLPVGEITFIEVGAVDVQNAPVVIGSADIREGIATYQQNAAIQAQADAAAKAAASAAKKKAPAAAAPVAQPQEETTAATDLKALLAQQAEVKAEAEAAHAEEAKQEETATGEAEVETKADDEAVTE